MNNNSKRVLSVLAIIFIVFNVLSFIIPFEKTGVFFVAYIFGMISIISQVYFMSVAFNNGNSIKSKFYGFPIARIAACYLISQMVVSLIEMIVADYILTWIAVVIDMLILAAALIGGMAADAMREEVEKQDIKANATTNNMTILRSLIAGTIEACGDSSSKKMLESLGEEFQYSDPVTSEASESMEKDMIAQIKNLQTLVINGNRDQIKKECDKISLVLKERNRICKSTK